MKRTIPFFLAAFVLATRAMDMFSPRLAAQLTIAFFIIAAIETAIIKLIRNIRHNRIIKNNPPPMGEDWKDCETIYNFGTLILKCNNRADHDGPHESTSVAWLGN